MKCEEVIELMQRFLDGDLSSREELHMLQHLEACPECTGLFERLKALNGELAQLPRVVPPFSIVDSILPKLEELGLASEQDAAAEIPAIRTERKRWMSWRLASGLAAAGIVLGLFIFNQMPVMDANSASELYDRMNYGAAKKESAAAPQAMAGGSAPKAKGAAEGTAASSTAPVGSVPMMKDQANTTNTTTITTTDATSLKATSADSKSAAPKPSPAPVQGSVEKHTDSVSVASPSEAVPASPQPAATAAPAASGTLSTGNDALRATIKAPLADNEMAKALATPVLTEPHLASPDGVHTAWVRNNGTVAITGRDGLEWYVSNPGLKAGQSIHLVSWSEDSSKLIYKVHSEDGKEHTVTIDIKSKTETKS